MAVDVLSVCMQVLMGFVSSVILIATLYLAFIWYQHKRYDHIPGPKRSSFVFGNWAEMQKRYQNGDFLGQMTLDWMTQYGLTIKVIILHNVMVMTADLDSVKDLLITGGHPKAYSLYKRVQYLFGQRFFGTGLVSELDTKAWERKRAIMNPAFHRGFLKSLMPQFNDVSDSLLSKLSTFADGKTKFSLGHYFHCATLDVIGKVAFGMDINSIENDDCPFPRAIFKALEGFSASLRMEGLEYLNPRYKSQLKKDTRDAIVFLRQTGKECLAARRSAMQAGQISAKDILSYVVNSNENNPDVTDEDLLDEFITFFVAGQETTANTLSFALMELGKNPQMYKRLKEEVDSILGSKVEVTYEDISKLEYTSMVLKETLRMFPPGTQTFRQVDQDQTIGGYLVPAKTNVTVSIYASSRLSKFHPNPTQFDPERFSPKNKSRPNTYAYFPFSIGPRSCIGQTFAQIESKVLLAKFIQRFDMQLDLTQSFDIQEAGTLRPKSGVMATLTVR